MPRPYRPPAGPSAPSFPRAPQPPILAPRSAQAWPPGCPLPLPTQRLPPLCSSSFSKTVSRTGCSGACQGDPPRASTASPLRFLARLEARVAPPRALRLPLMAVLAGHNWAGEPRGGAIKQSRGGRGRQVAQHCGGGAPMPDQKAAVF